MDTLLGIDLGTTGIKAAICTPSGQLMGDSYLEYPLIRPEPGVVEQDADLWWSLTRDAIRQALHAAQVEGSSVRALSISSQGISFVPVDAAGRTLGPSINWLDSRAMGEAASPEQIKELKDKFRNWVVAKFGGDWDKAFRTAAGRSNSDNTINREELLWALNQAGIGNWITRGAWADGIIAELDKGGDRTISEREFNSVFRLDQGTDGKF